MAITVASLALTLGACGGDEEQVPLTEIESSIRTDYQEQLHQQGAAAGLNIVSTMNCVRKGDDGARCIAEVAGDATGRSSIDVTIDGDAYTREVATNGVRRR